MRCRPENYYAVALERFTQGVLLRREQQYALAMYVSGLSAECMLRSFHDHDVVFDQRHDVVELFKVCAWKLDDAVRRRLHASVNVVHSYWDNAYRYADERRLRAHLRSLKLPIPNSANKRTNHMVTWCRELEDACGEIIQVGEEIWRKG